MRRRIHTCSLMWPMAMSLVGTWAVLAQAPAEFVPQTIELENRSLGGGWNVCALLKVRDRKWTLARFDGEHWSNLPLDREAHCIAETKPGIAHLGTSRGLMKVEWPVKKVQLLQGPNETVLKVVGGSSNSVFCASWFRLYERTPAPD